MNLYDKEAVEALMARYDMKHFEAVLREGTGRESAADWKRWVEETVPKAQKSLFFNRVAKEAALSDMAQALGVVYDSVIDAAVPALIGREMIWVLRTSEALVRFVRAKKGKALRTAEGAAIYIQGEKQDKVDVTPDIEVKVQATWSRSYVEDASWNVLQRMTAEAGRSLGELETTLIINHYNTIAAGDLASGGALSPATANTFTYADLVTIWDAQQAENLQGQVAVLNPAQLADQVLKDDKFIHMFYFGRAFDVARGVLGDTYLGYRILKSTLTPAGTVFGMDVQTPAAVMLLRRDVKVEPFEDPTKDQYGIVATERVGLGTLRSKGVAKMTGA